MDLQSVSTKGKISNPPRDHARPAVGSEVPSPAGCLLLQKTAPTLSWRGAAPGQLLCPVTHTWPGPRPLLCCAASPWACPHSPSPWAAWQLLPGRGAAGETSA